MVIVSGEQENLGTVCEGDRRSTDGLGDSWSSTAFTEVREGVVVVSEGLGSVLVRLGPEPGTSRVPVGGESRSGTLAAEREDAGLWGRKRFRWDSDMPPSPPSSSMCSSRPAGKEERGEAQVDGRDRARKGEEAGG